MVHRRRRSRYYSSSSSSSDSRSSWSSSSSSSSDSHSSWSSSSSSSSDSRSSWSSSSSSSSDSRSSWSSSSSSSSDSRSSWSSSSSSSSDSDSSSSRSSPAKRLKTSNHGSSKRLKTSYDNDSNVGIDRISELPDLVLHHILSFMDMEEVIGNTSLISRRWRNLWLSLPILNFDQSSSMRRRNDQHSFSRFIDRVLLRRDHSFIKSLSISMCLRYPPPMRSFEDWMIYAARKNVEQVCLNIRDICLNSPQNLLWPQFSKIQVFKLQAAGRNLLIPQSLFLDTQLKYLYLDSVRLPEAKVVTLSCSVLENLTITCCTHRHVNILKISAPKLTNLELTNEFQDFNETCKLQISAPNLTSLLLKGTMYQGYSFENLTSLVKARIDFQEELDDADFLRNILEGLHNVTTLELCIYGGISGWNSINKSLHMVDHHRGLLNTFVNLKCLNLNEWSAGSSCMHVIHSLLTNSYFLEDLVLKIDLVRDAHDWRELFPCIHRLKSFEIQDVRGSRHELKLFEFILKNAVVLEDFTIHSHWKFRKYAGRKELAKFNMKIHALPRASSSVKILVFFPK